MFYGTYTYIYVPMYVYIQYTFIYVYVSMHTDLYIYYLCRNIYIMGILNTKKFHRYSGISNQHLLMLEKLTVRSATKCMKTKIYYLDVMEIRSSHLDRMRDVVIAVFHRKVSSAPVVTLIDFPLEALLALHVPSGND